MAMNSSIKNSRLLITGTLLHHKHQLRDFFNRYACLHQQPAPRALNPFTLTRSLLVFSLTRRSLMGQLNALQVHVERQPG